MQWSRSGLLCLALVFAILWGFGAETPSRAADHNDPNAVNSIFSDVPVSAADLYGMFGYPSDDTAGGEKVVVQLTFASIPSTGVFDTDMLYKINLDPDPRPDTSMKGETLESLLDWAKSVKDKYLRLAASEVRVSFNEENEALVSFVGFPGGDFKKVISTNEVVEIESPEGHVLKAFIGGRDDPFFNDLPGFFRSINYVPQFYLMPRSMKDGAESEIPKTLLELEGNTLFNFDPENPKHGSGVKEPLPDQPFTWDGDKFLKDEEGNYRFVYSGRDAQVGRNVNAIVLEIPLSFMTRSPQEERIVRTWGESWVLTASAKAASEEEEGGFWAWLKGLFSSSEATFNDRMEDYRRVDTVGVPFLDAALSEREDKRQLGADNITLARHFVMRLGHLGWGFGPSISALGLGTCFDHGDAPVSVHKTYKLATTAFPRAKKCLFQKLYMPDDSWKKNGVEVELKRTFEVFIPNVTSIDMDTTGTWPYGRRPEDQVASRFLAVFLDMETGCGGKKCHLDVLGDQAVWDSLPIVPKTPPNPLKNDKEFLDEFPYLAEPWGP